MNILTRIGLVGMARDLANEAMNTIVFGKRTFREWVEIIEKNQEMDLIIQLEKKIARRDELLASMGIRIPEDDDPVQEALAEKETE